MERPAETPVVPAPDVRRMEDGQPVPEGPATVLRPLTREQMEKQFEQDDEYMRNLVISNMETMKRARLPEAEIIKVSQDVRLVEEPPMSTVATLANPSVSGGSATAGVPARAAAVAPPPAKRLQVIAEAPEEEKAADEKELGPQPPTLHELVGLVEHDEAVRDLQEDAVRRAPRTRRPHRRREQTPTLCRIARRLR